MKKSIKAILIDSIMSKLNEVLRERNKKLCANNLHSEQIPLHGSDMFFKLAFLSETKLHEIAKAAGL